MAGTSIKSSKGGFGLAIFKQEGCDFKYDYQSTGNNEPIPAKEQMQGIYIDFQDFEKILGPYIEKTEWISEIWTKLLNGDDA